MFDKNERMLLMLFSPELTGQSRANEDELSRCSQVNLHREQTLQRPS